MTIGSGGVSVAFASGLSPTPLSRFQSPLSEPDVRFSRIRLSSGIMRLAHRSPVAFVDSSCGIGTLPYSIHFRSRVAASPVDALTTPASSADPFTFACDPSGVSGPFAGVSGFRHSRDPSPFGHRSSPEAPSLHRRYPASPVLRASPPPCRPGLPLAGSRLMCAASPSGFPVLPPSSPSMCASVITPTETDRCPRRSLPHPPTAFP